MWEYIDDDCIFCGRYLRKRKGLIQNTSRATSDLKKKRICQILTIENCVEKLCRVENASSICYHRSCLAEYDHKLFYEVRAAKKPATSLNIWTTRRLAHDKSFSEIRTIINEKVIVGRHVFALQDIFHLYLSLFQEEAAKNQLKSDISSYDKRYLCARLMESFPKLSKTIFKNRTFLHLNDMSLSELLTKGCRAEDLFISQIKSTAFEIRKKIVGQEKRCIPKHNVTIENIYEGECEIPIELYTFISSLIKGPKECKNKKMEVKVKSICDSIIYSTTRGAVKTSTCLSLALVTKSITGSRKMVEILNRLGHCVSYTFVEELESELAYGCAANTNVLPYGLVPKNPMLRTHVAFDNYDKFVETSSGKDTLHDTVGIVYQNTVHTGDAVEEQEVQPYNTEGRMELQRRRRTYHSSFDCNIEPYIRKTQTMSQLVGGEAEIPESLRSAIDLNNLWMIYHALNIDGATRWFVWNSERGTDENPIQKIGYLPNLNMSPTSEAVVRKTLQIALDIANECDQRYIVVTYDLAIASKAFKIQADLSPDFDRIFIMLGSFHTELSFFKVINSVICAAYLIWDSNLFIF